ncbi:LamG-like jellyroll fold domain-containing protein [Gaetbulibacter saemankumensis]|uniref:LamG-like jellyroll fold domain-containing protein n=1 Tax=Gaetbulibacter saemankumensis TaxID=311208 RepID=UPI00042A5DB9|nr:LamG-like jellyroll fold domain-containing protein [Gaetbulibacter saemankumensis]
MKTKTTFLSLAFFIAGLFTISIGNAQATDPNAFLQLTFDNELTATTYLPTDIAFTKGGGNPIRKADGPTTATTVGGITLTNSFGKAYDASTVTADSLITSTSNFSIRGSQPRTICAWVKTTAGGFIWQMGYDGGAQARMALNLTATALNLQIQNGATFSNEINWNDGNWHHVAVVYPGGTLDNVIFYFDGVDVGNVGSGTSNTTPNTYKDIIKIGHRDATRFFSGQIDDIRIYDIALSPGDINEVLLGNSITATPPAAPAPVLAAHYKFENNYDDSAGSLPLQLDGTTWPTSSDIGFDNVSPAVGTYNFQSAETTPSPDDRLVSQGNLPSSLVGNSARSISAWVRSGPSSVFHGLVFWGDASTRFGLLIEKNLSRCRAISTDDLFDSNDDGEGNLRDNEWHHLALTYHNGKMFMYVDGNEKFELVELPNTATSALTVGADITTGRSLIGDLDDIRLYEGVLSKQDVLDIMKDSTLGIEDNRNTSTFKAYPNPVNDILTIASKTVSSSLDVAVYNILGAQVKTNISQEYGEARVDMRGLAPGFYSVIVTADGKQSSLKILKK